METYKRQVGYESFGRDVNLVVTATTLYFPFILTQNVEDMGIYTDTDNISYEIINMSGSWDQTSTNISAPLPQQQRLQRQVNGTQNCSVLNNCTATFVETPITSYGLSDGDLSLSISNCSYPQSVEWVGPNNFTSNNLYIGGLSSGSYTAKITDNDCNITYVSYYLHEPQALSFNLTTVNNQTNALIGCNGSASVFVQGGQKPYTYLWFTGNPTNVIGVTSAITSLCAGVYTVRVSDTSGTIISSIFTITQPAPLSGSVISTLNVYCYSGRTGYIKATGTGGYAPTGYTYNLTGPVTSGFTRAGIVTFDGLSTGNYNIQIIDALGSTYTTPNITITEPNQVGALITTSATTINATITLSNFSGGTSGDYSVNYNGLGPITTAPTGTVVLNVTSGSTNTVLISRNGCPATNYTINAS